MRVDFHNLSLRRRLLILCRNSHRERFWEEHDQATYECPSCGRGYEGVGERWEVHHKDGDAFNGHAVNLVALCHHCHRHTHSAVRTLRQIEEWKQEFLSLGSGEVGNIATGGLSETAQATLNDFARTQEETTA